MVDARQLSIAVEGDPGVGQGQVENPIAPEDAVELPERADRILEMLEEVIGDHEIERSVRERGEVLGVPDHGDGRKRFGFELGVVPTQFGLGHSVDVGNPGVGRNGQRMMQRSHLDAAALQPARQAVSFVGACWMGGLVQAIVCGRHLGED